MAQRGIGRVEVTIRRAHNLVNSDIAGLSDPYVTFKLSSSTEKERQRTKTRKNDLNPVWDEGPFTFVVESNNDQLEIVVKDQDFFGIDESLGMLAVPVGPLARNPTGGPQRLLEPLTGVEHGELELDVLYIPNAPSSSVVVGPGMWVSEAALWVEWENRGVLVACKGGELLALDVSQFLSVIALFKPALARAALYARAFVAQLKRMAQPTDIMEPVLDYMPDPDESPEASARSLP